MNYIEKERLRLAGKITEYLELGGLFNPECMEHDKVRDLLIECREWMTSPEVVVNTSINVARQLRNKLLHESD